jgi:hypothetical protein
MEVTHHKNKVGLFLCFDESRPVLVIDPECIQAFNRAFEGFEVEGGMEGIVEK